VPKEIELLKIKSFSMIDKLIKIQQELKVPKGNRNTFGNYNYRSCEDIVEHAKPLCHAEGLALTLVDEVVEVGGRVYVKATASLYEITKNEVGESKGVKSVYATGWAREAETKKGMDEAQITGSASSYARKYALNGLFAIDDTKDADTENFSTEQAFAKLASSSTLQELTANFKSLSPALQKDAEVIAKAGELKNKLA
jgi:ERF superfamily